MPDEELRDSAEFYRRLLNNARDLVYRMSLPDGRYVFVSSAAKEIFGVTAEEMMASPLLIRELIHPDHQDYFREEWAKLLEGRVEPEYEYRITTKAGQEKWLNQRNVLIRDDQGRPVAIEGIVTDISERKATEQRLRESEQKYHGIFDESVAAIFVFGVDGRFLDCNQAAVELLGYSRDELYSQADQ